MKQILFALLLITGVATSQKDYTFIYNTDSIIGKGVTLHDAKKYDEAVAEFNKVHHTDPEYLRAQYEKAMSLSAATKKDELRLLFTSLHSGGFMSDYPSLYTLYGNFLSNEKEYDASEKIFNEGLKFQPNSSVFLYNMGILYVRKGESQKALDIFKKVVTLNPNHASSHYLIGLTALENGKIVEGTLALISYLIIAPTGRYAHDAILKLNAKFAQNYLDKNKLVFTESGDDFSEMEVILRNQLPLKSAYKVKSEIDDVFMRQIQAVMEYAVEHKMGDGFFETTYMPWAAEIIRKNQFEGFSYYILLGEEETLGKKLTSQKKKITAFYENYLMKDFWDEFGKRNVEHFGTKQDVVITLKDGVQNLAGPKVNGKNEGRFKRFNADGNVTAEFTYKYDLLDGIQKYYDQKGNLIQEIYFVAGKKHGKNNEFYPNGNPEMVQDFKDDLADGPATSYYYNGGKECELSYRNGERDGNQVCYYPNGAKKSELTYNNGKANGSYTSYNESGDLTARYQYIDDLLDGEYVEYYDGKTVKSEAKYKDGKILGIVKTYYPNATIESETAYTNGTISKLTNYRENGKISSEILYDEKGNISNYYYADWNGNKYYDEKYKGGELKSAIQYTKANPAGAPLKMVKNQFLMTDYEGSLISKGELVKGIKNKEWEYYSEGNLKTKESYINGAQTGLRNDYSQNGMLNNVYNSVDDNVSGLYEDYDDGVLSQSFQYFDGDQNGPYQSFYTDGKIYADGFISDNKLTNEQNTYWIDGKIRLKSKYYEGDMIWLERLNAEGARESETDYKNKTGKFSVSFYNGTNTMTAEYVNGVMNGKYVYRDKYNNPAVEAEYINDVLTNIRKDYSPSNALEFEAPYYNGKIHGLAKKYDLAGNYKWSQQYVFGDEYGTNLWLYRNKNKINECSFLNGAINGDVKYYNLAGQHIASLVYENGILRQYVKMNAEGAVSDVVNVINQAASVVATYPNGKTAFSVTFEKGNMEGMLTINNLDGKPDFSANYSKNLFNGERIEYYPNGKIYKKEHLVNGQFEGLQEYFTEDGRPLLTANYKNTQLHGDFLMYANGKLSFTKKYNSDELVEIIK
jgi:antitoxin component YwqK of YwqJK toxin-antitoxin module/Tfp pilus assembly protein PilF